MTENNKPRGIFSIVFIGLLLTPAFLMCWMSKGRWALSYFAVLVAWVLADDWLRGSGLLPDAYYSSFGSIAPVGDLAVSVALNIVGIAHALWIRKQATARKWFRWVPVVPLIFAGVLLPVRTFLFHPFNIPSASNAPNLMAGDIVLVSKFAYGYSRFSLPLGLAAFEGRIAGGLPQRGDVTFFRLPSDTNVNYVKRVIGLPGDRIQMIGGVPHINGAPVKLEEIKLDAAFYSSDLIWPTPGEEIRFFRETLPNGRSYVIADAQRNGSGDDTQEFVVPPGHYFMMGDNRDNSQDSRYDFTGYVPEENFVGPVAFRVWNGAGFPLGSRPK